MVRQPESPRPSPRGPNFPRRGLLRHAGDPDPRLRQLGLEEPESADEPVQRFSRNPTGRPGAGRAGPPALRAAPAVRLFDDPHGRIRHHAARHPALPPRILVRLLTDTGSAEVAARNPALPLPVVERMVRVLRGAAREEG
ncbi:hypothetical protein ACIQUQ_27830 [Streptomyces sp. NPDC101118]|uniref:hypothetical protein n=1 Tax=Streptomyces sp. NPDC101118 TaxID=3366109 RepID=UPI0037F2DEE8